MKGTGGQYRTRTPEHTCRNGRRSGQEAAPTSDPSSRENESGPKWRVWLSVRHGGALLHTQDSGTVHMERQMDKRMDGQTLPRAPLCSQAQARPHPPLPARTWPWHCLVSSAQEHPDVGGTEVGRPRGRTAGRGPAGGSAPDPPGKPRLQDAPATLTRPDPKHTFVAPPLCSWHRVPLHRWSPSADMPPQAKQPLSPVEKGAGRRVLGSAGQPLLRSCLGVAWWGLGGGQGLGGTSLPWVDTHLVPS